MTDGAGDTTEEGDEVGVAVALAVGLSVRDGCGELSVGAGLVGLTVGAEVAGVTVAGVVGVVAGELAEVCVGLTQR